VIGGRSRNGQKTSRSGGEERERVLHMSKSSKRKKGKTLDVAHLNGVKEELGFTTTRGAGRKGEGFVKNDIKSLVIIEREERKRYRRPGPARGKRTASVQDTKKRQPAENSATYWKVKEKRNITIEEAL